MFKDSKKVQVSNLTDTAGLAERADRSHVALVPRTKLWRVIIP